MDFENKLLDDNTEIHKTAAIDTTASDIPSSTFSDSSYQKIAKIYCLTVHHRNWCGY